MADTEKRPDFSGYATKYGLPCSDGRTIKPGAFRHMDGAKIPMVWQHGHNDIKNILGYAQLQHREDGVYALGYFNDTPGGQAAKLAVTHKDIVALSIYANQLVEKSKLVHSGQIRELSLVLSGANPGAFIDNVNLQHADGETYMVEDEVIISPMLPLELPESVVTHADAATSGESRTVGDVVESMTEEQKKVMYALIAQALEEDGAGEIQQSNNEGENFMKRNVFDPKDETEDEGVVLTHAQVATILEDAKKMGSLKDSFLAHAGEYGITNIDYLFPDARAVTDTPTFIKRDTAWVNLWMGRTKHTPFSRIKSMTADITLDTARALGYIKGHMKKEEFFALAKRVTTPTTIYKKQKLDRDDIVDIVDFDVVVWLKAEMRMMLDEEVARAGLIGDGRDVASEDKINEANIRPVYKDADLYTIRLSVASNRTIPEIMEDIIRARKDYKGVGNPVMFTTTAFLTEMLLLKDGLNRRMYNTVADVAAALRVSEIVEVPVMENVTRTDTVPDPDVVYNLLAILVNPSDYTYGADKGGQTAFFDDFDIDYNQQKYLLETRLSGALTNPKTAMVVEQVDVA